MTDYLFNPEMADKIYTSVHLDEPVPGHDIVMGISWADGIRIQHSTAVLIDATAQCMIASARFHLHPWADPLVWWVEALNDLWKPTLALADTVPVALTTIRDAIVVGSVPIMIRGDTASRRNRLLEDLFMALNQGKLTLYYDPELDDDLREYRVTLYPSGWRRYQRSPHKAYAGDPVWALALAWHASQISANGISFA